MSDPGVARRAFPGHPPHHMNGLRSPAEPVGGIVYFGRMLDKIRLHQAGALPPDYHANLGGGFDERCVHFLRCSYSSLTDRVKEGGADEELLAWAFGEGQRPDDEQIEVWNEFMRKRGWNDPASPALAQRKAQAGLSHCADIQTFFAFIDADEGRG